MTRLSETDKRFRERASDINDLDDVVRELGIEDSHTTPAEAVRELKVEIERLQGAKRRALASADERSREAVELRAALVAAETTLVRLIRADLFDKDFSGMQISNLVDTNPTIVKIRAATRT